MENSVRAGQIEDAMHVRLEAVAFCRQASMVLLLRRQRRRARVAAVVDIVLMELEFGNGLRGQSIDGRELIDPR